MRRFKGRAILQGEAQSGDHFQDRGEVGTALAGQRFVEALACPAGLPGNFRHALSTRDKAERLGVESGVGVWFVEAGRPPAPEVVGFVVCQQSKHH